MTITVAHYDLGVTTFTSVLNMGHTGGHLQVAASQPCAHGFLKFWSNLGLARTRKTPSDEWTDQGRVCAGGWWFGEGPDHQVRSSNAATTINLSLFHHQH